MQDSPLFSQKSAISHSVKNLSVNQTRRSGKAVVFNYLLGSEVLSSFTEVVGELMLALLSLVSSVFQSLIRTCNNSARYKRRDVDVFPPFQMSNTSYTIAKPRRRRSTAAEGRWHFSPRSSNNRPPP